MDEKTHGRIRNQISDLQILPAVRNQRSKIQQIGSRTERAAIQCSKVHVNWESSERANEARSGRILARTATCPI